MKISVCVLAGPGRGGGGGVREADGDVDRVQLIRSTVSLAFQRKGGQHVITSSFRCNLRSSSWFEMKSTQFPSSVRSRYVWCMF